ncbi:MAG: stalk domain-containing protein [Caldisericaceae bacterium]
MRKSLVAILIFLLLFASFPSKSAFSKDAPTLKGICVHGEDLSKEGIDKSLSKIASFGYNAIFFLAKTPEGKVYFKSKNCPMVSDIFGDVVKYAHKNGLKVYAYFPVIMDSNYVSKYPKEKMVNIGNSSNTYYVSLLSSSYIKYLEGFIGELLAYDIDGILLDYIRYPNGSYDFSDAFNSLASSSKIDIGKVKDLAYKTFVKPADWKTLFYSYEQGDADVVNWVALRESVVRNVSSTLIAYAKSIRPSIKAGAFTVARGYRYDKIAKAPKISASFAYEVVNFAQTPDVFKGILDFMAPMVYLSNLEETPDYAQVVATSIKQSLGSNFPVYVAINPDSITLSDTMNEIYYAYKVGDGITIFRYPLFQMGFIQPNNLLPKTGKSYVSNIVCSDGKSVSATFSFSASKFVPINSKAILISPYFDYYSDFLTIGSTAYSVNGETHTMDVSPFISDSRTFVPIRFIAEAFGLSVAWDELTNTVTINGFIQID